VLKLEDHLLTRLLVGPWDSEEEFTQADRNSLRIDNHRLYIKKFIRINYTTDDLRRDQDTIGSRCQNDIMVLSGSDEDRDRNPYWFGRVISIFSVKASTSHQKAISQRGNSAVVDVLFIRWFGHDSAQVDWGLHCGRMPKVGFLPAENPGAFGFVNPDDILRRTHIIPDFASGRTQEIMGPSIARIDSENDSDYNFYYVSM